MDHGGIEKRLREMSQERLRGMRRGVEKESLRSLPDGQLALTPHASALGSALTHPHITTDFSESQLEFVTDVHASAQACLEELVQILNGVTPSPKRMTSTPTPSSPRAMSRRSKWPAS